MTPADKRRDPTPRASEEPTVSTAPAAAPGSPADISASPTSTPRHRWWAAIPRRLGRARTSTVVLAVLFLAVFALWLNVKPPAPGATPPAGDPGVSEPTAPAGTTEPTQPAEPEEPVEPTEEPVPTTQSPAPTTRPVPPTTTDPTPTTTAPETTAPAPTGGTDEETAPGA